MSILNQRQVVITLVVMAGLAGCAAETAQACPPEESSALPALQQMERDVLVLNRSGRVTPALRIAQMGDGANGAVTVLARADDRLGSTLETRVYQPGEAMTLYGLKTLDDGPTRVLRVKENGHDIRVEQHGEKITATIDGKEVPAGAVTIKDGTIEVRDAAGTTVLKEEWAPMGEAPSQWRSMPGMTTMPPVPGITWPGESEAELPKVMLGITMDEADEDTIQQLGLPEGDYTVISTVPEGLPAAKAGLKARDIVVSVDGKTPASSDTIRDVMKAKKPGDKLNIEVARKGSRVKLDIPLEAFDRKRFPAISQTLSTQNPEVWRKYSKEMEQKAREMSSAAKNRADLDRLRMGVARGENEPMIFMSPGEGTAKLEERLRALEDQIKRLEEVLKRLESRTNPATPSGGGGSPTPSFVAGL